jgi:D-hydroxyproline dehydrogenase subunit gamma
MPELMELKVNGTTVSVPSGATVAVAIALAGATCRKSVSGELRGPLCGMGICFECRAAVDGRPYCRTCQVLCRTGMEIITDE